ncbi:MAG: filamentous hemagglutinin N-terminal domain-containing protein, partial [Cyanobacteria bacterium P01_F01_bin.116]
MVPAFLPPSVPIYLPNEAEQSETVELNSIGVASSLNSPSFSNGSRAETLLAQAIVPSDMGTVVTPGPTQTDITGGQLSGDGTNLFHNFQEFGLTEAQIANFIASPEIQNILGNVSGGDVSFIDGVLQVTGGDANLFLINPAGIIFGANAELNLNGDFTATTADRIGFGHDWLDVLSPDNYQTLIGEPNQFGFTAPGSVLNFGTLSVASGQNLTLLGGTVVNDGELLAADGNITLLAVPGETLVRINPANTLLGLEISPLTVSNDSPQLN